MQHLVPRLCYLLLLLAAPPVFAQGNLTPPGAPVPTMKSLDQIDGKLDAVNTKTEKRIDVSTLPGDDNASYIIGQSGSYYLGGNVSVTGKTAISIRASNVTLDLNGFTIDGGGGPLHGINAVGDVSEVVVRNGIIRGWTGNGIAHTSVINGRYDNLNIRGNQNGISVGTGAQMVRCLVSGNGGAGIEGLSANRAAVYDSSILDNGGVGVRLGGNSTVQKSIVRGNGGTGIEVGAGSLVQQCTVFSNRGQYGIFANAASSVLDCAVGFNTPATTGVSSSYGIFVQSAGIVDNCTSYQNSNPLAGTPTTGVGFAIGSDSTIRNCVASGNKGDGIRVTGAGCQVTGNTADDNGLAGDGAGIHVTSSENRIDGNHATGNDRGFDISNGGNLIIRNSAKANGPTNNLNYFIFAENRYGPIVNLTGAQGIAVTGNAGPSTLVDGSGGSHPWANFAY